RRLPRSRYHDGQAFHTPSHAAPAPPGRPRRTRADHPPTSYCRPGPACGPFGPAWRPRSFVPPPVSAPADHTVTKKDCPPAHGWSDHAHTRAGWGVSRDDAKARRDRPHRNRLGNLGNRGSLLFGEHELESSERGGTGSADPDTSPGY